MHRSVTFHTPTNPVSIALTEAGAWIEQDHPVSPALYNQREDPRECHNPIILQDKVQITSLELG